MSEDPNKLSPEELVEAAKNCRLALELDGVIPQTDVSRNATNPPCPKCGGDSVAVDHNSGIVPGIGHEEETKYHCESCSHEWWD